MIGYLFDGYILCVKEVVTHFISYFIKWVTASWT